MTVRPRLRIHGKHVYTFHLYKSVWYISHAEHFISNKKRCDCMKETRMPPAQAASLVANSGNTIYGVSVIDRVLSEYSSSLEWRHNGHNGISNHQPHDCSLNRLFRPKSQKTSQLHVTGLCEGNSLVTGEFPTQRASNAENVSIWWHHHIQQQKWLRGTSCGFLSPRKLQAKTLV